MKLVCVTADHRSHHIDLSGHGWSEIVTVVGGKKLSRPKSLHSLQTEGVISSGSTITMSLGGRLHTGIVTWETNVVMSSEEIETLLASRQVSKSRPTASLRV